MFSPWGSSPLTSLTCNTLLFFLCPYFCAPIPAYFVLFACFERATEVRLSTGEAQFPANGGFCLELRHQLRGVSPRPMTTNCETAKTISQKAALLVKP